MYPSSILLLKTENANNCLRIHFTRIFDSCQLFFVRVFLSADKDPNYRVYSANFQVYSLTSLLLQIKKEDLYRSPLLIHLFYEWWRIVGKRRTSRIAVAPVKSITRRSIPKPQPPVGGIPYSSASMNSSSIG